MKHSFGKLPALLSLLATLGISGAPLSEPDFENEQLHYNINWPSGLSLGEAQLRASVSKPTPDAPGRLHLEFDVEAGIPGFSVIDRYRSETSLELCSSEFKKSAQHGQKKTEEKTVFEPQNGSATRETAEGGKSELTVPACPKDALAFLYFVRRELSQGRIPPQQKILFGAPYDIRIEFMGAQRIQIAEKQVEADRVNASVKGPASEISFEVFFLKDRARTPALVRVPLSLGTFSMELVR
jgi:hypothetical protein